MFVLPHRQNLRGNEVVLNCNTTGTGILLYSWTKNGQTLEWKTSLINITFVDIVDTGNYACTATNGILTKSSNEEYLNVLCKFICYFIILSELTVSI